MPNSESRPPTKAVIRMTVTRTMAAKRRTSGHFGQATLRISSRTSRRYVTGPTRSSGPRRTGGWPRVGWPCSLRAPIRFSVRFCSRFRSSSDIGVSIRLSRVRVSKQGRRDSNPRPSVLETDALPTELLPSKGEETLPGLLVDRVATVVGAVLLHLQPLTVVDLRLHRDVVAVLALGALEGDLDPLVVLGHGRLPLLDDLD